MQYVSRYPGLRDRLKTIGILPIVTFQSESEAIPMARAIFAGGLDAIEITLRTADALRCIATIRQAFPDKFIAVGTIRSEEDAGLAADAGADLLLTPGLTPELLGSLDRMKLPLVPGVATTSEAMTAAKEGLLDLKLFPAAQLGGMAALRALNGPLPELSFCPSGGVGLDDLRSYLSLANVACVSGSWMLPKRTADRIDYDDLQSRCMEASKLLASIRSASADPSPKGGT